MNFKRTQIYLDPEENRALRAEAHARGISLAQLMREIVHHHLEAETRHPSPARKEALLGLIGLGASGKQDVSERHDAYVGEAAHREHSG